MTLRFTSINNMFTDERSKIQFVVAYSKEVIIDNGIEFEVFEFIDPKSKQINRFEFSNSRVNLIAGVSTLLFELNKKIPNEYWVMHGKSKFKAYLYTFMNVLENKENLKSFSYTLHNEDQEAGKITISLEILD